MLSNLDQRTHFQWHLRSVYLKDKISYGENQANISFVLQPLPRSEQHFEKLSLAARDTEPQCLGLNKLGGHEAWSGEG